MAEVVQGVRCGARGCDGLLVQLGQAASPQQASGQWQCCGCKRTCEGRTLDGKGPADTLQSVHAQLQQGLELASARVCAAKSLSHCAHSCCAAGMTDKGPDLSNMVPTMHVCRSGQQRGLCWKQA